MKMASLKVIRVIIFVICCHQALSRELSQPCQPIVSLDKCQCLQYEGKTNTITELECVGTDADTFYTVFDKIKHQSLNSIQIRDSDLAKIEGLAHEYLGATLESFQLDNANLDIKHLPHMLDQLGNLKHILIDNNKHQVELTREIFLVSTPVETLDLNGNGLTNGDISNDAFENIKSTLKVLRMRNNKLTDLPLAIEQLSHLEELDVSNNPINYASPNFNSSLRALPSLKSIHVDKIDCKCSTLHTDFLVTFIKEKQMQDAVCSEPSKFAGKHVLRIDSDDCPGGSEQTKLSIFVFVTSLIFLLLK